MISLCGKVFYFIAKIFCYLGKIKRHETILNFEVIYEIIIQEKNNHEFDKIEHDNDLYFIELLKIKLKSSNESGRKVPNDKDLN